MTQPTDEDLDFYRYDENHRFAAMYPLLARQIFDEFDLQSGVCLDVGTGSAALIIELAKLTQMEMIGLDTNSKALELARENVAQHGLPSDRFQFLLNDVCAMPLPDASVDLLLSRGSIPFWTDLPTAFKEINRVLAPGGKALVGCGFSRYQPLEEVKAMRPDWSKQGVDDPRNAWKAPGVLPQALAEAGLNTAKTRRDEYGVWVEISKPGQI
ncbi:class I SAM-dependent methyltransferase [Desulfovibrio inopinatus]|uniref:class I SAM-dependent methyltransferase n=1 Tax=Desulfovibrio inopinatus TaxID=102109 RepID=UPI0004266A02|nr:class I SAM-dependent methyltransferase [Desulfovibrio inopinatus]